MIFEFFMVMMTSSCHPVSCSIYYIVHRHKGGRPRRSIGSDARNAGSSLGDIIYPSNVQGGYQEREREIEREKGNEGEGGREGTRKVADSENNGGRGGSWRTIGPEFRRGVRSTYDPG